MAISIDTSLWRMRGSDEERTLVHIKQISTGLSVSRPRKLFPSVNEMAMMGEDAFNEMCRVSFHSTDISKIELKS